MQRRTTHKTREGKQEGEGVDGYPRKTSAVAIANHASINFYQDEHPDDFFLVAPNRSQKCGDCGLWMATVEESLICPRCGLEVQP